MDRRERFVDTELSTVCTRGAPTPEGRAQMRALRQRLEKAAGRPKPIEEPAGARRPRVTGA